MQEAVLFHFHGDELVESAIRRKPLLYVCSVNSAKLRNLLTRSLTGLVFVTVVLGAVFGGLISTIILFGAFAGIGLAEYFRLSGREQDRKPDWLAVVSGIAVFFTIALVGAEVWSPEYLWFIAIPWIVHLSADVLTLRTYPFSRTAVTLSGWIYIGMPFSLSIAISSLHGEWNPWLLTGFFLILWTNDTGAYLSGMAFGRTKLFPAVSPNKTWEGLIGGVLLALGVALLLSSYQHDLSVGGWMLMALCVAVFGNTGDLYESYLKRAAGVKDSGRIMPGHGGVLDRFDGLLFSLPAFLALYYLIQP